MNKEDLEELLKYNLDYLEARNCEDIFGGDYTSLVDLEYANKEIDKLQQENLELKQKLLEKMCSDKDVEYQEKIKLQQRIDKAIGLKEEIMYLANKTAITTQNVEVKAIRDRLENIFEVLKGGSNENTD